MENCTLATANMGAFILQDDCTGLFIWPKFNYLFGFHFLHCPVSKLSYLFKFSQKKGFKLSPCINICIWNLYYLQCLPHMRVYLIFTAVSIQVKLVCLYSNKKHNVIRIWSFHILSTNIIFASHILLMLSRNLEQLVAMC